VVGQQLGLEAGVQQVVSFERGIVSSLGLVVGRRVSAPDS
jgi:hypothetical protein